MPTDYVCHLDIEEMRHVQRLPRVEQACLDRLDPLPAQEHVDHDGRIGDNHDSSRPRMARITSTVDSVGSTLERVIASDLVGIAFPSVST
ncbi:MAG TPA: hypothetical protein VGF29_21050 [Hyphomicrobiaceae bacterium]